MTAISGADGAFVPHEDQFEGSLIGQALGDALGAPVEGMPPATCRRYVELELRSPEDTKGRGRGRLSFGQYTDDTQLARELLISILACRGFEPGDYAKRIESLFTEGRVVGRGRATSDAASRLRDGCAWDEAGTPPPAAGNGSAMRAGPIGLLYWYDAREMVQAAVDQGRITHLDPRCAAGSIAIAGAVSLALRPGPIDPFAFLDQLSRWVVPASPVFARSLDELSRYLDAPLEDAVARIGTAGLPAVHPHGWGGISPFVIGSVLWSLFAFLRSPDDYWTTICTAIWPGGDVDSTAAMAGAISGAHLGLDALPHPLASSVADQGTWTYGDLLALARDAYRLHLQRLGSAER